MQLDLQLDDEKNAKIEQITRVDSKEGIKFIKGCIIYCWPSGSAE